VLDQPKIGLSRARNLAVQSSTGEFLAVLDADDQWTPRRLEVALDAFKQDPSLDLVFGHMRQFRDGEDPETKPAEPAVLPGGAVLRRSAYDRVGSYNSAYNLSEFLDWLMRAREVPLREILLPDVVLHRRIHDRNIGVSRTEEKYRTFLHSIKTGLARRRARPS
jgi:glycosyltransferase involved in cell wall biosynthesis